MARRNYVNEEMKAALAFEQWVKTEADDVVLECRVGRHAWPGILSKHTEVKTDKKTGNVILQHHCERGCGVYQEKYLGADGIIERASRMRYDYSDTGQRYLLPKEARTGRNLTRQQRGQMTVELLSRRSV